MDRVYFNRLECTMDSILRIVLGLYGLGIMALLTNMTILPSLAAELILFSLIGLSIHRQGERSNG